MVYFQGQSFLLNMITSNLVVNSYVVVVFITSSFIFTFLLHIELVCAN